MKNISEIIDLIANGDETAFERFYDCYYEQVFHFAYYFLKEKESCKEVVSDVFFSVWKNREKLKEIIEIEPWLYVLTKNRSLRYMSQNKKNVVSFDDAAFNLTVHLQNKEDISTPYDSLLTKEMDAVMAKAINKLPEKCRAIFVMSRVNGLKTKDIAEILSLQESTVRVQLKIAVEKIVTFIKPHFPHIF
ncbi:MAG: RNA polymerase sigma-70 factor [Prevotella sp.]|nr:RNA polymerase sigma-70 factor [Prevotella sp.]